LVSPLAIALESLALVDRRWRSGRAPLWFHRVGGVHRVGLLPDRQTAGRSSDPLPACSTRRKPSRSFFV